MFQSIHKIDEGLFICGVSALQPAQRLRNLGIHAILNAAQAELYHMGHFGLTSSEKLADLDKEFDVCIIGAMDAENCNLSENFKRIADFMEAGRAKGGVVVHCAAGISRASTSACAYMMIKEHWELDAAIKRIHSVRNIVHPNAGFWRQLRDLEASLKAQGVKLKPLPPDWQPCPQPQEAEALDERASGLAWWGFNSNQTTEELIEELDSQARSCESFATVHLVAVLEPAAGTSAEDLAGEMKELKVGGVRIEEVSLSAGSVSIRALLVPSFTPEIFRDVLLRLPRVSSATVEGAEPPPAPDGGAGGFPVPGRG